MSIVNDMMDEAVEEAKSEVSEQISESSNGGFSIQGAVDEMIDKAMEDKLTPDEDVEKEIKLSDNQAAEIEQEKLDAKTKDEEKQEDSEENDELVEEKTQEETGGEVEEQSEQEVAEIRLIEAIDNDGDIVEVPETIVFKKKVDGEEVDVTVKELLDNYSGQKAWDKKFTELGLQKKQFEQESGTFKAKIEGWANLVKENKVLEASMALAKEGGLDPIEFHRKFKQEILTIAEKYAMMSDEERRNSDLHFENEYLENERRSEREAFDKQHAQNALQLEVRSFQDTHNLSNEELIDLQDKCLEKGWIRQEQLDDIFVHGKEVLNTIKEYMVLNRNYDETENILNSIDPKLFENDILVDTVMKMLSNNKSKDSILRDLKSIYGVKTASDRRKILSKKQASVAKKKAAEPTSKDDDQVKQNTDAMYAEIFGV